MSLKETYQKEVVPKLREQFGYTNVHAVPTLKKISLNIGVGKGLTDNRFLETAEQTLIRITGQRPQRTKARKSIAAFKIRQGNIVGLKVTLRGKRMWDFLNKMLTYSLPRKRDFRGISAAHGFDAQGNYSLGFKEHIAFPEIHSDEIEVIHGLQVTCDTSASSKEEAFALLQQLGFPFKEEKLPSKK